jgi:hypothetical protein
MQIRLSIFLMGALVVLLGSTEPTCTGPMEVVDEGEACGDDIDTQCAEGLYCAFGEVRCGTPPVVGVCRPMGTCGNEYDCLDENNIWYGPECVGDIVCGENVCGVDCDTEPNCLDLPVEECEANGCEVFYAHPYDQQSDCYLEELQPAFCMASPDIVCGWQGDPIVMTEPDGTSWYAGWSCFSTPENWDIEAVPEEKPACGEYATEGEACGDDIDTQCAQGLYCAFGEVWCGTPPVVGVCRPMGSCGNEYDCLDENNIWYGPECEGDIVCQDNACGVDCDIEPNCLDLPVEECEANGCEVFYGHAYDIQAGCYQEEMQPAFCKASPDILCYWEGYPIVMTEPDGTSWYAGWSCFTTPESWDIESVPEGKPACE